MSQKHFKNKVLIGLRRWRHNKFDAASLRDQQRRMREPGAIALAFDSRAEATVFADSVKSCGAKIDFVYQGDKRLAAAAAR